MPLVLFGAATAAYQIEGAWNEDGKGPSIWDEFVRRRNAIANNDTGDVACDHYHRWREDVELMAGLGSQAYRFSISWPRILPEGTGRVEERGLAFYDGLVDALLECGIQPWVTLYHRDLPLALQERGGWQGQDVDRWFAEYARAVAERLGDRVRNWMTLNEPWVAAYEGHLLGVHAPGIRDPEGSVRAAHGLMRAHQAAVPAIRAAAPGARVGLVLNVSPTELATDSQADAAAAERVDGFMNRWFLDAAFGRGYPADLAEWFRFEEPAPAAQPIDFIGLNYYFRSIVRAADSFIAGRGYAMRFGIVHVDYSTQKRTVKTSGRWYAERVARDIP